MSGRMQITDHVHALKIPFFVAGLPGDWEITNRLISNKKG